MGYDLVFRYAKLLTNLVRPLYLMGKMVKKIKGFPPLVNKKGTPPNSSFRCQATSRHSYREWNSYKGTVIESRLYNLTYINCTLFITYISIVVLDAFSGWDIPTPGFLQFPDLTNKHSTIYTLNSTLYT